MEDPRFSFLSNTVKFAINYCRLAAFKDTFSFLVSNSDFSKCSFVLKASREYESVRERNLIFYVEITIQIFQYCQQIDFIVTFDQIEKLHFLFWEILCLSFINEIIFKES